MIRVIKLFSFLLIKVNSIGNPKIKRSLLNAIPFWIGAFLTGIIAVLYAKLFSLAEDFSIYTFLKFKYSFFVISPLAFVFSFWIVKKFAPYSGGSGIPQVMASIEMTKPQNYKLVDNLLAIRVIVVKISSSLIMIFGGAAIGREGPTIQIAASIFKKINEFLPSWYPKISKRNMIMTGAAAGLASAFNTPLGGIVFAIEELTKTHFSFFKSALFTGVIIAGLTALNFLGPYLYLGYPELGNISISIIFAVIIIALATGISGCGLGQAILFILKRKKKFKTNIQKYIYTFSCGLIIALIAYFIDIKIFGSGKDIMVSTLFSKSKYVVWYLPILRILGPILAFTTGAAGGVFAPSLSAGASMGSFLSSILHLSPSETNLIILCGMVGFLTGITRSPFTSSILVIEMTNSHNIIFYLMLTALISNIISNLINEDSFYDQLKVDIIKEINEIDLNKNKSLTTNL